MNAKIGIVIPSLFRDEKYLRVCESAIKKMAPSPDEVFISRNDGESGLGFVRSRLFGHAFIDHDCDIILQCSSDFQLFPGILNHVSANKITTFAYMIRKLSMPIQMVKFLISPKMWTGCYSIPKGFWLNFRASRWFHSWDGQDNAIAGCASEMRFPIKRVRSPQYLIRRPSQVMKELVRDLPLHKKILKLVAWF